MITIWFTHRSTQLGLLLGALLLCVLAWLGPVDIQASDYATDGILKAGGFFALLRFLNATISVLQELSINFPVTLAIGQVLDPVNDLVEFASEAMKYATISFILQRLIIEIVSTTFFNLLLTVATALWGFSLFSLSVAKQQLLGKVLLSLIFVRFSIVVLMLSVTLFNHTFTEPLAQQAVSEVENVSAKFSQQRERLTDIPPELQQRIETDLEKLTEQRQQAMQTLAQTRGKIAELRYQMTQLSQQINERKAQQSVIERFTDDTPYADLAKQRDDLQQQLNVLQQQRDNQTEQLDAIEERYKAAENQLYAPADSRWLKYSSNPKAAWDDISDSTTKLVDNVLTALTIFLFQLVLLPLLFLYLIIKAFRRVWLNR
ncbi:hypothetical protein CWI84_03915 [Idiomarina tyrosinivorans]|uniref:Uncharacterized protein n=1 Tax=Idiomarina tyrosinivorans TaxID=1445662 RepID=A0A432ZS54_9GAMM|nr:hypothetical protein [Idiomarina tyrosinivorans]RUO80740.1 hypothetical protein CWI84_03915 [Idiomarina tyrosinivorans]